jgi:hypothetical protein
MGSGGAIVKIELGPFARSGIEAHSGSDVASGVHEALLHFTGGAELQDMGPPPSFFQQKPAVADDQAVFLLAVDPSTKAALRVAAERHGMSMQEIVKHAVMVYLARMDAVLSPTSPSPAYAR